MKTVLITGSSRGIGAELAKAFGTAGYAVGINCREQIDQARAVEKAINSVGNKETAVFQADVRDSLKVRQMMDAFIQRWKRLDVLINNAGINRDRTILKMTNGEWNDVVDVNLSGAFWCLREASRVMVEQKSGAIINIASIVGIRGGVGNANYAAAKAGLIGLTKGAARELGRLGIRVNAVLPGFHETDMSAAMPRELKEKVIAEHVMGHFTRYEDLAAFVRQVAENQSISGQILSADSRIF
jgi:3-oxoacyl-[acyl-carrier protein] reductase